ncbi:type IV toxin-antitoxin system AbiEi family antitoxin domain-containing protein [Tsukamurella ocularis]|uniref:type IV toxin-antitoxin system AbiEi family antitoxin domain-containing protein n=1 Tax=Tsukamurella ocularis TaxID=1970234 RepID=UPI002167514F|nr:type IV toxin-antitoxin system AbiEi family antitoxin domain-containing protein [Tsukamurella ocularis]MCS3853348.1 hypothetical protein [Tsukamurella ocularis]
MKSAGGLGAAGLAAADVAAEQWGVATSAQLSAVGVNATHVNRLVEAGVLDRLHQGVYRLVRFPLTPLDDLRAAWIGADRRRFVADRLDGSDPLVVVSHLSAAAVYEVGDLAADEHSLTARRRMRLSIPDVRVHVDRHLQRDDWTVVDGLLVTTPLRTVADLIAGGIDGEHIGAIMRDLLQRDLVQADELVALLDERGHALGYKRGHGQDVLDELLELVGVSSNTTALARGAPLEVLAAALPRVAPHLISRATIESAGLQHLLISPALTEAFRGITAEHLIPPELSAQLSEFGRNLTTTVMTPELTEQMRNTVANLQPFITPSAAQLGQVNNLSSAAVGARVGKAVARLTASSSIDDDADSGDDPGEPSAQSSVHS